MQTIPGQVQGNVLERHQAGRGQAVWQDLAFTLPLQLWIVVLKTMIEFSSRSKIIADIMFSDLGCILIMWAKFFVMTLYTGLYESL